MEWVSVLTRVIRRPSWMEGVGVQQGNAGKGLTTRPGPEETPVWSSREGTCWEHGGHNGGSRARWGSVQDGEVVGGRTSVDTVKNPLSLWQIGDHCRVFNGKVGSCCHVHKGMVTSGVPWEAAINIPRDFRSRSPMWTEILGKNKLNNPRGSCVSYIYQQALFEWPLHVGKSGERILLPVSVYNLCAESWGIYM